MKKIIFGKPTINTYIIGYLLSVVLTVLAFVIVQMHLDSGHLFIKDNALILLLLGFAVVQLAFQLIFFLHVLHEDKPRWNLLFFIVTLGLVLMIVFSSIWIMNNLNHNMTPQSMHDYILQDEGIKTLKPHNGY